MAGPSGRATGSAERRAIRGPATDTSIVFARRHPESLPYLRSMCSLTDLWMIFQVRRCSARALGSPSRAARADSRSSFRWLASLSPTGVRRRGRLGSRSPARRRGGSRRTGTSAHVGDVIEGRVDALVGAEDLQRADARRVDEKRPARQLEQLAVRRRVATARVGPANLSVAWRRLAEQHVDERRLADTGRAQDRRRGPGQKMAAQEVEAVACPGGDRDDRTPGATALTATSRPSTSSARSALLRTTTGVTPLDQATAT